MSCMYNVCHEQYMPCTRHAMHKTCHAQDMPCTRHAMHKTCHVQYMSYTRHAMHKTCHLCYTRETFRVCCQLFTPKWLGLPAWKYSWWSAQHQGLIWARCHWPSKSQEATIAQKWQLRRSAILFGCHFYSSLCSDYQYCLATLTNVCVILAGQANLVHRAVIPFLIDLFPFFLPLDLMASFLLR